MVIIASLLSLFGCQSPGNEGNEFENDTIVSFSLSEGGGMNPFGGFGYSITETKDGRVHFLFNEGHPDEKEFYLDDHSVFDSLQQIIMKHKMYTYQGNYDPPIEVTDGASWSLHVRYKSKKSISAGGYMAGPEGYREAFSDIMDCLDQWKNMPMPVNEVVSFRYEYGPETYLFDRKDDHAELTYDNKETGDHQVLVRDLEMLEDIKILLNIYRLKTNNTRGTVEDSYTLWMFEVDYSNGDHYRYEGYDSTFECGYTVAIKGLISDWMKDEPRRNNRWYY